VRIAAILGPLLYGLVTWGSGGQQRLAIAATALLFLLGLWVLSHIDWNEALHQADRDGVVRT